MSNNPFCSDKTAKITLKDKENWIEIKEEIPFLDLVDSNEIKETTKQIISLFILMIKKWSFDKPIDEQSIRLLNNDYFTEIDGIINEQLNKKKLTKKE